MWLVKKVRKEREFVCLCVCTEWEGRGPGFKGENNTCQASCLIDYIPQPPKY